MSGGVEQPPELVLLEPVALLSGLWRWLEIEERIGHAVSPADPAQEAPDQHEAPVVGRGCGLGALLVGGQVVDDRCFLEEVAAVRLGPGE